jgi:hypothetical protein
MDKRIKGNYVECPHCKTKKGKKGAKELCLLGCPKCVNGMIHVSSIGSTMIVDEDNRSTN